MVEDGHLPFRLHHTVHGCHLALSGTHSITKPAFAMARKAACKPDTKNGCTSNPPHLQADSTGGTHLSKQYVSSKRIHTPKMIQKGPCQRKPEHTMSQPNVNQLSHQNPVTYSMQRRLPEPNFGQESQKMMKKYQSLPRSESPNNKVPRKKRVMQTTAPSWTGRVVWKGLRFVMEHVTACTV